MRENMKNIAVSLRELYVISMTSHGWCWSVICPSSNQRLYLSSVCHVSVCVFSACQESSGGKWAYGYGRCHAWRYGYGRRYAYGWLWRNDEPNDDGPHVTSSHDGAAAHDVAAAPYDGDGSAAHDDATAHDDASANDGSATADNASAAGPAEPNDAAAAHVGSSGPRV